MNETLNPYSIKERNLIGRYHKTTQVSPNQQIMEAQQMPYGLADAPRCWYLRLQEELLKQNVTVTKYDSGLFYYIKDGKLQGLTMCFVDILWGGTDEFKTDIINCLRQILTIGSKFSQVFTYLGTEIHCNNNKCITIKTTMPKLSKPSCWP